MTRKEFRKLTVVTQVDHFKNQEGNLVAYTPYVREMDLWCELFAEVHIYAPGFRLTSNSTLTAFRYNNIKHHFLVFNNSSNMSGLKYVNLLNKILIFIRLLEIPLISLQLLFGILKAEFVLVRSPGYPALVANLILRVIKRITIVKWAGGFHNYPNERFLSKFERKLLLSCNDKTRVLIYDRVENPRFIHFIPALMSKSEIQEGLELSKNKLWNDITNILCVGRLHQDKGFDLVLEAMDIVNLKAPTFRWELYFVGGGKFISRLKEISAELNLSDKVSFMGALSFAETQKYYARTNIVIMPGVKEGWPKVIAEGWAHNALVLAANRGNVPDILSSGAGIAFEPDPADLAQKLIDYFEGKIEYKSILYKGIEEVQNYSLEAFKMRITDLIHELKSI